MTTLEDKIFTLKQNNIMKKMKEIHFLNNLISDERLTILKINKLFQQKLALYN